MNEASARGVMRIRPGLEVASLSDVGCQRVDNEDRYLYWEPENEAMAKRKGRLAIIADGMGGYEGGQEASRIAVETVCQTYANGGGDDPQSVLIAGFSAAHQRIVDEGARNPALHGMGTTCTAIALIELSLYYAHVGDSRLYLVRGAEISRVTRDHSYVSRLVENGVISLEEAESHPQRHILTAALGAGSGVTPESPDQPIALKEGDVLVLCTDGLWSLVHDDEIHAAIADNPLKQACHDLVQKARQRGGPDNITVLLLRINSEAV